MRWMATLINLYFVAFKSHWLSIRSFLIRYLIYKGCGGKKLKRFPCQAIWKFSRQAALLVDSSQLSSSKWWTPLSARRKSKPTLKFWNYTRHLWRAWSMDSQPGRTLEICTKMKWRMLQKRFALYNKNESVFVQLIKIKKTLISRPLRTLNRRIGVRR